MQQRFPSINADPDGRPPPVHETESEKAPPYDEPISRGPPGPIHESYSPPLEPPPPAQKAYLPPQPPYEPVPQQQHYSQTPVQPPVQPQAQTYMASVPLQSLNMSPTPVDCPICGVRSITRTSYEAGNQTHICALLFCFFTGLGCIPYLFDGTKDVVHRCSHCGVTLAKWYRGRNTEVLAHPTVAHPMAAGMSGQQFRPPM